MTAHLAQGLRALGGGRVPSFGSNRVFENGVDGAPTGTVAPR